MFHSYYTLSRWNLYTQHKFKAEFNNYQLRINPESIDQWPKDITPVLKALVVLQHLLQLLLSQLFERQQKLKVVKVLASTTKVRLHNIY